VVRVVVADDHPLFREALAAMISHAPGLALIGQAPDGRAALSLILEEQPDVALLDVDMGGFDGPDVMAHLRRSGSATRVLFVSAGCHGPTVRQAIGAGGGGFVTKTNPPAEIVQAVRRVASGELVLCSSAGPALAGELRFQHDADLPVLSEREGEVLALVAEGRSVAEIGSELHLSPATVKTHLQSLYGKLGVSERAAAVAAAMRRNLIP
jgi:two-component system nitrate/nitrite response regulator NarL